MKKLVVFVLACVVAAPAALAAIPRFADPVRIESGGTPVDLGYYTAPLMFDWNADGKKDIVTGQFHSGRIAYFENVGDDSAPVFSGYEYLYASGQEIQLPSG